MRLLPHDPRIKAHVFANQIPLVSKVPSCRAVHSPLRLHGTRPLSTLNQKKVKCLAFGRQETLATVFGQPSVVAGTTNLYRSRMLPSTSHKYRDCSQAIREFSGCGQTCCVEGRICFKRTRISREGHIFRAGGVEKSGYAAKRRAESPTVGPPVAPRVAPYCQCQCLAARDKTSR